jgi:hypothetical protein
MPLTPLRALRFLDDGWQVSFYRVGNSKNQLHGRIPQAALHETEH